MRRGCKVCGCLPEDWETDTCEACGTSRKLTKYQQEILNYLKSGGKLKQTVSGWHYKGRLLRAETEDAIRSTGNVQVVNVQGKRMVDRQVVFIGGEQ